jgi:3-deoxy-7-phosphoheptulonate synthase
MGADHVSDALPPLLAHVRERGYEVVWSCDPCHGNTYTGESGYKTRRYEDVMAEVRGFFGAHDQEGTVPGGVHVELTGEDVTECVGGARGLAEADLHRDYRSAVDPRLNYEQALEMAMLIARRLRAEQSRAAAR